MGKHNGKARKPKGGISVGGALVNKARREGRTGTGAAAYLHTTDPGPSFNMQSVLEGNDLQEIMSMAELANRNFAGEKEHAIVISMGSVAPKDQERAAAERAMTEQRNAHRLKIPRRPSWTPGKTTPEQLEEMERASFLQWRRDLADLESDESLVLTPFEKNLEVWRQLWRVVERSDIVVQVVDGRDPLTYRCEDLEEYCREIHATKHSVLLINKSDLLPESLRSAWADYFDSQGIKYAFWSARAATEEQELDEEDRKPKQPCKDPRAELLDTAQLIALLQQEAQKAVDEAEKKGITRASRGERLVVGLTGYPNVGKSSTINALFGSKKTAVAATPGKTKHFQTLNVSDSLCLCDCPGLVMPRFARSKAEMVAAGVVPVDRLTDIRAPVAAVAARVSREQLEKVYSIHLPRPAVNEDPNRPPTAQELLRSLAASRGWMGGSSLPDETRAGRRILKDYVDGKILHCMPPPGASPDILALTDAISGRKLLQADSIRNAAAGSKPASLLTDTAQQEGGGAANRVDAEQQEDDSAPSTSANVAGVEEELDLDLLESLNVSGRKAKPLRPDYKFHKKAARAKTRNIKEAGATYDGAPLEQGKRGGLVRVTGY